MSLREVFQTLVSGSGVFGFPTHNDCLSLNSDADDYDDDDVTLYSRDTGKDTDTDTYINTTIKTINIWCD